MFSADPSVLHATCANSLGVGGTSDGSPRGEGSLLAPAQQATRAGTAIAICWYKYIVRTMYNVLVHGTAAGESVRVQLPCMAHPPARARHTEWSFLNFISYIHALWTGVWSRPARPGLPLRLHAANSLVTAAHYASTSLHIWWR